MDFEEQLLEILTDPAIAAVILTVILGSFLLRRQLVIQKRVELNDDYGKKLEDVSDIVIDITSNLRTVLDILGSLGDKSLQLTSNNDPEAVNAISKEMGRKFDTLGKLLENTFTAKTKCLKLFKALSNDPMISQRFETLTKALYKDYDSTMRGLDNIFQLLSPLNTLRPEMSGGKSVPPELFSAVVAVTHETIDKLQLFKDYLGDAKEVIHNELVGNYFLFKKYHPAYLKKRSVMTKHGIRDYSVESSQWLRIKILFRTIF